MTGSVKRQRLRGTSREFEGRIRNQALDRPDDEPIAELLLSFCDR